MPGDGLFSVVCSWGCLQPLRFWCRRRRKISTTCRANSGMILCPRPSQQRLSKAQTPQRAAYSCSKISPSDRGNSSPKREGLCFGKSFWLSCGAGPCTRTDQALIDLPCFFPLAIRSPYVNQVKLEVPMKTNTSLWRLFRQGTATGLVLLLIVIGSSPVAEAGEWIRRDWSKVQRIASGARTRVLLYKDRAPGGIRKVEGQFQSASTEVITLLLPDGQTLTLRKQAVEKVLVYRPIEKRYQGWITAGATAAIFFGSAPGWDLTSRSWALSSGLFVGLPTGIAFLAAPRWGGIYNVPRKLRDAAAPEPPPAATKQSSSTSGSGLLLLEDKAFGPELRSSQPRPPLLREKLLAELWSRPVHAHRSGID